MRPQTGISTRVPRRLWTDLYVSAASHLCEVLVLLQGFIHLVVSHAVATQAALSHLIHLCKDHKFGHVGHSRQLSVQQVGKGDGLCCPRTVRQPESAGKRRHAVIQHPARWRGDRVGNLMYRAETLVVKLAQSFAYKSLVVPVMSSQWAGAVPPTEDGRGHRHYSSPQKGLQEETDEVKTFYHCVFSLKSLTVVPMTEQSRRRLVVSPSPESRGLSLQEGGKGIRSPMGRWNLRRRGSTVTTGLKFAWLPSSFATSSSGTGWAWGLQPQMRWGAHTRARDDAGTWTWSRRRRTIWREAENEV